MTHIRHILLVDDDAELCDALSLGLPSRMSCKVSHAGSYAAALERWREARFDAVILDVQLPDGDGRELCAALRSRGLKQPIIMLSGAGREADVVRGLEAGANDYVVKPFRLAELAARLQVQIRSFESSEEAELAIGPFVFRPGAKTLQLNGRGRATRLTEKEAAVLKFLYRADGAVVTRETLLRAVWGYAADACSHTVETHIYRLRRKVEPTPQSDRLLVSDAGGYRLLTAEDASAARHRMWLIDRRVHGVAV